MHTLNTEQVVAEADAWLDSNRKSAAWRTLNRVRDELVRAAGNLNEVNGQLREARGSAVDSSDSAHPQPGDLLVWYFPQVGTDAGRYSVRIPRQDLRAAKLVLDAIVGLSSFEFQHNVKPDYADAAGIARWEENGEGGWDWFDVDESEYSH